MELINHFGYSRPRIDNDTSSPKGLIRIQSKTESKDSTSNKSTEKFTPYYNLPPNILHYKSANSEPANIKVEEYSGSVLLASCKRSALTNRYIQLRKNLPVSNQSNITFE